MTFAELFEPQTWKLVGIALRRVHKDRRARKLLGAVAIWILGLGALPCLPILLVATILFMPQSISSFAVFFGLGIALGIRGWRMRARQRALLDKGAGAVPAAARRTIFRATYWLATLMRRCESEFAMLKVIPPEIEIVTRRVLLDQLKSLEIWEEMPPAVRELQLKADGHWTELERNLVADKFEFLVCLRWVTRKDKALPVLALEPVYRGIQAKEIVTDDGWFRNDLTAAPAEIDRQLKTTARFLERCSREGVARGLFPADEERRRLATEENGKMDRRARAEDWLVGRHTVGEIGDQELRQVHRRALLRFRLLRSTLQEMTTSEPEEGLSELIGRSLAQQVTEK